VYHSEQGTRSSFLGEEELRAQRGTTLPRPHGGCSHLPLTLPISHGGCSHLQGVGVERHDPRGVREELQHLQNNSTGISVRFQQGPYNSTGVSLGFQQGACNNSAGSHQRDAQVRHREVAQQQLRLPRRQPAAECGQAARAHHASPTG
jgi:hypothetical protein